MATAKKAPAKKAAVKKAAAPAKKAAAPKKAAPAKKAAAPKKAARLAVMLPAPKRFEKRPGSAYLSGRAATILARMGAVVLP